MNNYHLYQQEGRGKYSVVYKGRKRKSLQYLAIKRIEKNRRKKVQNEVNILSQLHHPNIIRLLSWNETKNHFWMILQYCPGGDLLQMIEEDKSFPQATILSFMKEILLGIHHCHSNGILFCDLKPANILVNQFGCLKLSDFGAARKLVDMVQNESIKKGTPFYMAPQLFGESQTHSFKSDFWSLGCIMYQLATGNPPFVSGNISQIPTLIARSQFIKLEFYSQEFNQLLNRFLCKSVQQRITWQQIKDHSWWKSAQISALTVPVQTATHDSQKFRVSVNLNKTEGKLYSKKGGSKKGQSKKGTGRRQCMDFVQGSQEQYSQDRSASQFVTGRTKIQSIQKLLQHSSDTTVRPIIGNKDIERIQHQPYQKQTLPFHHKPPQEVAAKIGSPQAQQYLQQVCNGLMNAQQKINILLYFQQILQNSDVANSLIKSSFVPLFLKFLKTVKSVTVRAKICQVIGLLIRHATVIDAQFAKFNLPGVFFDLMKDKSEKIRRRAAAALGQYLFYAATQLDEGGSTQVWDLPTQVYTNLYKILKGSQQQIVKFYIIKTIQNISAQSQTVGKKLSTTDNVSVILSVYLATKNEGLKLSCLASLHHLFIFSPLLLQANLQKIGLKHIQQFLSNMDSNTKSVQFIVTMLNNAIAQETKISREFWKDDSLILSVLGLVQSSSSVVKAKALIFTYFMLKKNPQLIVIVGGSKLFHVIQRLVKQAHKYVNQVLLNLFVLLEQLVPAIIKRVEEEFRKKHNEHSLNQILQVVFGYLSSSVLAPFMSTSTFIEALFALFQNWQSEDESRYSLTSIYELILGNTRLVIAQQQFFAKRLLPKLITRLQNTKLQHVKFNCLKIFLTIVSQFLKQDFLYDSSVQASTMKTVQSTALNGLLPLLPALLQQNQTITSCSLKLLAILMQKPEAYVSSLRKLKLLQIVMSYYQPACPRLNQHVLKIVERLVQSKQILTDQLRSLQVLRKSAQILMEYVQTQQSVFYEMPLNVIRMVLDQLLNPPNLFDSMSPPRPLSEPQQELNCKQLVKLANLLVILGTNNDQIISQKASESLAILMWAGVNPNERKWNAKDTNMLKNAIYWVRHFRGQPDDQTLARLNQRNMKA